MDPRNSTLVPPSTPLTCSRPSRTSAIATASVKRVACASVLSLEAARELGRVRSRRPTCAPAGQAHAFFALARAATSLRDSRATVDGGSERFQAVGEAGLRPASLCLILHRCWRFRLSGGGGIRTPEGPNGPCDFRDLKHFAQPCALRPCARHNARQFASKGPPAGMVRTPALGLAGRSQLTDPAHPRGLCKSGPI
jgi:hypothetical protein